MIVYGEKAGQPINLDSFWGVVTGVIDPEQGTYKKQMTMRASTASIGPISDFERDTQEHLGTYLTTEYMIILPGSA